jgi:putative YhbY family RNA-binding protein
MITLSSAQRRALKARAHHLQPVVMIGDAGLTPSVTQEIEIALKSHELIKIRVLGDDREVRAALFQAICTQLDAASVQHIGKILVIYRPRPEDAGAAPRAAGAKPAGRPHRPRVKKGPHRTKRSFQGS